MSVKQLRTLIRTLKTLDAFVLKEADKFVYRNRKLLTGLNVENLEAGIDSQGVSLSFKKPRNTPLNSTKAYTKAYEKFKSSKGGQTNYVDLRLLGGFHKSIVLERLETGHFTFASGIDIFPYLVANYGTEILGVTQEQLNDFAQNKLKPYLEERIAKRLQPK